MRVTKIQEARSSIQSLDEQILILLRERVLLGIGIARLKEQRGLPIRDRRREMDVLDKVAAIVRGGQAGELGGLPVGQPLTPAAARRVFKQIISETRRAEFAGLRRRRKRVVRCAK